MWIDNEFFIQELRESWESQKGYKTVEEFTKDNGISKSFFYKHIGTSNEVFTKSKTYKKPIFAENTAKPLTPSQINRCKELYQRGMSFNEIAKSEDLNLFMVMSELEPDWQDKQIEKYAYNSNNFYHKSIAQMMEEGISDREIANRFSVTQGKIHLFRMKYRT